MQITIKQLKQIMPKATDVNIQKYLGPINNTLDKFEINTVNRIAMFLGQIALESGELKYDTELSSGQQYENRKDLGNIIPGDGPRYKGKGILQLTGRKNYQIMTQKLKNYGIDVDLVLNPDLAKRPDISVFIACQYFKDKNINESADKNDIIKSTKLINGGLNGIEQRKQYWLKALKVLTENNL